jgi:hypothetical protein
MDVRIVPVMLAAWLAAGCGPRVTEVSGTVTADGMPLARARVIFAPRAESQPAAMAYTDEQGGYRLYRQGPGSRGGAVVGKYTVKVMSDAEHPLPLEIPPEYNSRSEIIREVKAGQSNVFDIDIVTRLP